MKLITCSVVILSLICVCLVPVGCAEKSKEVNEDQTTKEVREMLHQYYADVKKEGLLAELKYLDSTDNFYWHPPGFESAISYDSIRTLLTRSAGFFKTVDNRWDSLTITPIDEAKAHYKGQIHSVIMDTLGNENVVLLHEEGLVVKKNGKLILQSGKTTIH